ncbi:hypothetical protein CCO03_16285 [Comamonas serinivorans]|uniref:Uncharacterized protein n=1 Tax=Comamonas serinivorans TaxID=1082851 RepID=A0A1Y0EU88_9BURK|nr:hypothetical protein [Comamonas serinivorans]ARU06932.1 hypothetical protein CCO03_16285 [Comamonas serinivorans]
MTPLSMSRTAHRLVLSLSAVALSAALGGCYVVPMQPAPGAPVQSPAAAAAGVNAPMAPAAQPGVNAPITFSARMYPANDLAAKLGVITGTVTNDLHGRGIFTANVNGEAYTGEATRNAGSTREGVANAAGSRGGWMKCNYRMNSASLGTGQCELHNGARFSMHLGG